MMRGISARKMMGGWQSARAVRHAKARGDGRSRGPQSGRLQQRRPKHAQRHHRATRLHHHKLRQQDYHDRRGRHVEHCRFLASKSAGDAHGCWRRRPAAPLRPRKKRRTAAVFWPVGACKKRVQSVHHAEQIGQDLTCFHSLAPASPLPRPFPFISRLSGGGQTVGWQRRENACLVPGKRARGLSRRDLLR